MSYNPSHLAQFLATEISVSLEHKTLASDHHNSNKTAPEAFSRYRRNLSYLSGSCSGRQWPWLGVAGVAVVQYYFLTFDLHAIFNGFLCYTLLHADLHGHGWLERKLAV
jgi:hypothetical protein